MRKVAAFILIASSLSIPAVPAEAPTLTVHEWGTFTSFQDARGNTIPGINVDDEPVPKFVHRLGDIPVFTTRSTPALWSQGAPRCHPDVTLRLETPVLYFYPRPAFSGQPFDVRAAFVGGWLTEFFPFAESGKSDFPGSLQDATESSLQWSGLTLGTDVSRVPKTTERVWLAPRAVRSAVVMDSRRQESEQYLFYRGVGHIDAPLKVREQEGSLSISLRDAGGLQALPPLWVVRVQPNGRVRYRHVPAGGTGSVSTVIPAANEAVPSDLDALRRELGDALVREGLFKDEAQAMLATWRLSYFESEGIRVFFMLPRSWTDAKLPLSISVPSDITRVMLGRIELTSPPQRAALRRLQALPEAALDLQPLYYGNAAVLKAMHAGTVSHADTYRLAGREIPEALKLYDSLGRFRDALLVHEWRATSDETMRKRLMLVMQKFSACSARPAANE